MNDLTEILLKRRRAAVVFIVIFFVLGIVSFSRIPIAFYPQVSKPTLSITVYGSGQTAADLYTRFSNDLDNLIEGIEDVEKITARYAMNTISYEVEFPWNYDLQDAKDKVYAISPRVEAVFPDSNIDSFTTPRITTINASTSDFTAALYSNALTSEQLYQEAKYLLEGELNRNVRHAESIWFVPVQQVSGEVEFDIATMLSLAITPEYVINAVEDRYLDSSVGTFRDRQLVYSVRQLADIKDIYELENVIITTIGSQTIRLKDIAEVRIKKSIPSRVYRVNGETAVIIGSTPQPDGNIRTMSSDMQKELRRSLSAFTQDVSLEIVEDPAFFINEALKGVVTSIVQGALLAVIVTLLFLGVFKNALIVIVSLPLSLIYSFVLMKAFNVSINLISLSGMALSVGMTVDAAVVIVENLHRHYITDRKKQKNKQKALFQLVIDSVKEVRLSVIASLLTSICVFLPLAFTAALANALLGDLAKVVVFSLITSLMTALTIIPLLYYYLFRSASPQQGHKDVVTKKQKKSTKTNLLWAQFLFKFNLLTQKIEAISAFTTDWIKHYYSIGLTWLLKHPNAKKHQIWTLSSLGLFFLLTLFLFSQLKIELLAPPQSSMIRLSARNSDFTELVDLLEALDPIEQQIQEIIGPSLQSTFMGTNGNNRANYILTLDNRKYTQKTIEKLEAELGADGWTFSVAQYDPATLPIPTIYALHLRVTGPDRFKVLQYMEQLQDQINQLTDPSKIDRRTNLSQNLYLWVAADPSTLVSNEVGLKLNPETLSYLNLSERTIIDTAKIALNPRSLEMDHEGDDIRIRFLYPTIKTRDETMNVLISYQNTGIPLSHFFSVVPQLGISSILVEDKQEVYNLRAMIRQEDFNPMTIKSYERMVDKQVLANFPLDPGYKILKVDAQKDLRIAINSLVVALLLSVIFIFLILAVQFNSYRLPLIISSTLPLGVAGAAVALFLGRSSLSINSVLGIILLGGIAVNNSIMIIDFYLKMPQSMNKEDAIFESCLLRVIPILTSVLTTILGMLPLALALGDGSNMIQPLGIAVSGGLLISTAFTMMLIPAILALTKRPTLNNEVV
ncbi:MAG: efflux RND transporter permease subunit [Spirochaetia bacterium]